MQGKTNLKVVLAMAVICLGLLWISVAAQTIYVDAAATGVQDGSSWPNAYKYLQDALAPLHAGVIVVDDFESYDDVDLSNPASNAIFLTWLDGFTNETGSIIGYLEPPFCETTIVHGDKQAMPFFYDNDGTVQYVWQGTTYTETGRYCYSETERTFDPPQDWTNVGGRPFSLWFRGHPGSVGSLNYSGTDPQGPYNATMTGSGTDIWDVPDDPAGGPPYHDEFHFAFKQLNSFSGAVTVIAKVESVENTHTWAKAGVMIRDTLDGDSKHAFVCVTPGQGVSFQRRPIATENSEGTTEGGITAPHWVKLTRDNLGWFYAQHSTNGITWVDINDGAGGPSAMQISMNTNVYVGLAVTSHDANATCQAVFSNIQIDIPDTGSVPPGWINQDVRIVSNEAEQMYLAVEDTYGHSSVLLHDDPGAAVLDSWQEWNIDLNYFKDDGVQLNSVKKLAIGFGNRGEPTVAGGGTPGGSGLVFFDDIDFGSRADEILVAGGTYKPDEDSSNPNGSGDRTATFQLPNGVSIYGGYTGVSAPYPDARDIELYETILSGDLNGDDVGFTNNGENSYHVVTGSGTGPNTILDGFTITAGNANGSPPAHNGGGMYNDDGSPTVSNCIYSGNSAQSVGGGMYNNDSSPTLIKCVFSENSSDAGGGMLNDFDCRPILINCAFIGNSAIDGGGMLNFDFVIIGQNRPTLTNCIFSGNSVQRDGGGMCNGWSDPKLTNCTFSGNSAGSSGGGMLNASSNPTLTNCIMWGNSDSGGYDESAQIFGFNSTPAINYSCVQGWTGSLGGGGNIGEKPLFKDADGADGILGTGDDNLQLAARSPCIDAGDNTSVPADTTDLDEDGDTSERTPLDLAGNARFTDDPVTADTGNPAPGYSVIVEMGVYERYEFCGSEAFPYPPGDLSGPNGLRDCLVDFFDLAFLALHWLENTGPE